MTTCTAPLDLPLPRADRAPRPARDRRPAGDRGTGGSGVRLTRRGRVVVFGTALGAVLMTAVVFGASSTATDEPGRPTPSVEVVVGGGETLWGIASQYAEDGGTRALVDRIIEINDLDSSMVGAGTRIRVPLDQ